MSTTTYGWGIMFSHVGSSSRHSVHVLSLAVLLLSIQLSSCLPLDQFYPFNITGDESTAVEDDGGSPLIQLNLNFPFFNNTEYTQLYVNNNAIISFWDKLSTYKPMNFTSDTEEFNLPLIAPFWADVDIEHFRTGNETVVYRQTNDSDILHRATVDVHTYFPSQNNFSARLVFIVTWYNVGYYGATGAGKNRRNTFQSVMITNGEQSYVIFNYNKTVWTTGSNSGGQTLTGLYGAPAVAGFHSGNGTYYMIEHSGTNEIVNISRRSNLPEPIPGKYMFRVDGPLVDDLCCGKLVISPTSVSMMGSKQVRVAGPCLKQNFSVVARIREVNVTFPCHVVDTGRAICVTPTLFRTGELTFELNINGAGWKHSTTINIVQLVRKNPDNWLVDKMVTVTWDATQVPTHIEKTFEVLAYSKAEVTLKVQQQKAVAATLMSTNLKLLPDYGSYSSLVARLCWLTHQAISPVCVWSDVFPVRWKTQNSDESAEWCDNWIEEERTLLDPIVVSSPFCPCVQAHAESAVGDFHRDPNCDRDKTTLNTNCIYDPSAYQCYRRNLKSTHYGETCCYKRNGELMDIRDYPGAGTHQRYHYKAQEVGTIVPFFSYFESDMLPRLHCCLYSNKNCSGFKQLRNATSCSGYTPPSAAQAAGDPHMVTLDGKEYTFNGLGDFYLVKHVDSSLIIQVRAVQASDDQGVPQNATVFSHIAVVMPSVSDVVEIRKTDEGAEVLVNNRVVDLSTSQYRNISCTKTDNGTYLINLEPISLSVTVAVTPDLLNFIVLIGEESYKGNIRGLLGNYDKNPEDDFIARNGTLIPSGAPMREVHYDFGMTWSVDSSEAYLSQDSVPKLADRDFHPIFIGDIEDDNLRAGAREICKDNIPCLFDYQVTGKESVAKATMSFTNKFTELKSELEQVVIRCPYLDVPPNSNRTVTGYTNGSVAIFTCDMGFEMVQGTARRYCQMDSSWDGSDVVCAKKQTPDESSNQLVIIIGAVGSALVSVLLLAVAVRYCAQKRKPKPEPSQGTELDIIPIPVFENPIFMTNLQALVKDGRFRIPRPQYVDPSIYVEYF